MNSHKWKKIGECALTPKPPREQRNEYTYLPLKKLVFVSRKLRLHLTAYFSGLVFTVVSHDLHHVTLAGA